MWLGEKHSSSLPLAGPKRPKPGRCLNLRRPELAVDPAVGLPPSERDPELEVVGVTQAVVLTGAGGEPWEGRGGELHIGRRPGGGPGSGPLAAADQLRSSAEHPIGCGPPSPVCLLFSLPRSQLQWEERRFRGAVPALCDGGQSVAAVGESSSTSRHNLLAPPHKLDVLCSSVPAPPLSMGSSCAIWEVMPSRSTPRRLLPEEGDTATIRSNDVPAIAPSAVSSALLRALRLGCRPFRWCSTKSSSSTGQAPAGS
mmetsp:Transcript_12604/g.35417  ORF Transcript_12604/g.35417 Transcript_12604/m.35417 type:complete len:255 (+) Transcript_12604:282-1046(+)